MGHLKAVPSYSAADVFALFNDGMASNYVVRLCGPHELYAFTPTAR